MSVFSKENYYGTNVTQLLPHKPPFLLISHLVEMIENRAITQFDIPENHLLVENNHLSEIGCLENLAQTAALSAGYSYFTSLKTDMTQYKAPLGYMGSIKKIEMKRLPHISEIIETRTIISNSVKSGNTEILFCIGKIKSKQGIIAHGEFKLFLIYPE